MSWIESAVGWAGENLGKLISPGDLRSLLVDGVVAARGLVNTLEQVEELIAVGEERVGAPA